MAVPPMTDDVIVREKQILRKKMGELRAARAPDPVVLSHFTSRLSAVIAQFPEGAVAGVWPLPGEIDLRPLLLQLRAQGRVVCLPETPPKGNPLIFRQWAENDALTEGRFGTIFPDGSVVSPTVVLVPLLAFDGACYRLGYGGGYYDRTLPQLGATSVGFAWSWQEVAHVPVGAYDTALDFVVTESHTVIRKS